jgi:hypothetical protein
MAPVYSPRSECMGWQGNSNHNVSSLRALSMLTFAQPVTFLDDIDKQDVVRVQHETRAQEHSHCPTWKLVVSGRFDENQHPRRVQMTYDNEKLRLWAATWVGALNDQDVSHAGCMTLSYSMHLYLCQGGRLGTAIVGAENDRSHSQDGENSR